MIDISRVDAIRIRVREVQVVESLLCFVVCLFYIGNNDYFVENEFLSRLNRYELKVIGLTFTGLA